MAGPSLPGSCSHGSLQKRILAPPHAREALTLQLHVFVEKHSELKTLPPSDPHESEGKHPCPDYVRVNVRG